VKPARMELPLDGAPTASAVLSPCGLYRYVLDRRWGPGRLLLFLLVNPSTATADVPDATVRSMGRLARALGFDGFRVVNLFAIRSKDVRVLLGAVDPVGPANDDHITAAVAEAELVIAGWGSKSGPLGRKIKHRAEVVLERVTKVRAVHALRLTQDGSPEHPLYLPSTLKPFIYRPALEASR
jgi:hypothetical protein